MAKARTTYAKRQRDVEQKHQADQKPERRVSKKQVSDSQRCVPEKSPSSLSEGQQSVLAVFRKYLVNRGQMLCFDGQNVETFKVPLAELVRMGFLVAERFRGGYSLTDTGFAAMKSGE